MIKSGADIVSSVVRGFPDLDATFLSTSQHRKSRAGRTSGAAHRKAIYEMAELSLKSKP